MSRHGLFSSLFFSALVFLFAGCANTSSQVPREQVEGANTMPTGMVLGTPGAGGGEPAFWDTAGPLQRLWRGDASKETEERIARLEAELRNERIKGASTANISARTEIATLDPTRPSYKVGLVIDMPQQLLLSQQLAEEIARLSAAYQIRLVSESQLNDQASASGCALLSPSKECLGQLSNYPGIHALVVLSKSNTSSSETGYLPLQISAFQTSLGARLSSVNISLPTADGQVAYPTVNAVATQILQRATQALDLAPWHTKIYARADSNVVLSAGEQSGLRVGDTLSVFERGQMISSPSGQPAAWIPGPKKGAIRVDGFAGVDSSIAELVEGESPDESDILLLDSRPQ